MLLREFGRAGDEVAVLFGGRTVWLVWPSLGLQEQVRICWLPMLLSPANYLPSTDVATSGRLTLELQAGFLLF